MNQRRSTWRYQNTLLFGISGAVVVFVNFSCRPLKSASSTRDAAVEATSWSQLQEQRQHAREHYFVDQRAATQAFQNTPVGFDGMPALIVALLPTILPDLWNPVAAERYTGMHWVEGAFPFELHLGDENRGALSTLGFSCASCHMGRIKVGDREQTILGGPNTQIDVAGFRHLVWRSVNDPRLTAENLIVALKQKQPGWLYGLDQLARETEEVKIFEVNAQVLVAALKKSINDREDMVQRILGRYTYKDAAHLVNGRIPGSLDAFGFTVLALLIPTDFASKSQQEQVRIAGTLLPPQPPMVDIMNVWGQGAKELAQWDGNIRAKLMRNLGAELGVIGDPAKVNFANAQMATEFVANMPPPVYPFNVDLQKAERGSLIFSKACKRCHESGAFISLEILGVDGNRARGLSKESRRGLIAGLRAACSNKYLPECNVADDDILVDRSDRPGYLSPPLTGIWARAPYLHNGSVPTLYHMLIPKERPAQFNRGSTHFDEVKVGFAYGIDPAVGVTFDTTWPGFSNRGHEDPDIFFSGFDFSVNLDARDELLEYLKTL
jgi:hypothetical protein